MDNNEVKDTKEAMNNEITEEKKDAPPAAQKKKKKAALIVVLIVVLAAAAVAAFLYWNKPAAVETESTSDGVIYAVVLDENGEPVTDENGEPVTTVAVTDANGNVVVTTPDGKTVQASTVAPKKESDATTAAGGETTKPTVKKPDAPKAVTGLKVTDATEDSITIKWDKVSCDGYWISYHIKGAKQWTYYPKDIKDINAERLTKNSITISKLTPYTTYEFSVCAYNINEAGVSNSDWVKPYVQGDTLKMKEPHAINIRVRLPFDAGKKDNLQIYVKEDGADDYGDDLYDDKEAVLLDGRELPITLDKKYKGEVTIWVGFNDQVKDVHKIGNEEEIYFDLSGIGIDTVADDDEDF